MIVVDSNVIAYYFIQGDHTTLAHEVRAVDGNWIVPRLWQHELLNILAMYAQHGGLSVSESDKVWRAATELLRASERDTDMSAALTLAVDHRTSAYDAQFVALAQSAGVQLVTQDKELLAEFPATAVSMREFLDQHSARADGIEEGEQLG